MTLAFTMIQVRVLDKKFRKRRRQKSNTWCSGFQKLDMGRFAPGAWTDLVKGKVCILLRQGRPVTACIKCSYMTSTISNFLCESLTQRPHLLPHRQKSWCISSTSRTPLCPTIQQHSRCRSLTSSLRRRYGSSPLASIDDRELTFCAGAHRRPLPCVDRDQRRQSPFLL